MFGGFARRWHQGLARAGQGGKWGAGGRRKLGLISEALEDRVVMAGDITPSITGVVFRDTDGNGRFTTGEQLVDVLVQVYRDNGDGQFQTATDTITDQKRTGADGRYEFSPLVADARYFIVRPAQTVNGIALPQVISPLLAPSEPGAIIDQFATRQIAQALPPAPKSAGSTLEFANETEVIGRERDLSVELTAGLGDLLLAVNPFGLEEILQFNNGPGTQGERIVTWDGVDNDPDSVALGLNNRDLTSGGRFSGIVLRAGVDEAGRGTQLVLRLFNDRTDNFSEARIEMPVTGGNASGFAYIPFSDFTGNVLPSQVDAIQMRVEGGLQGADGKVALIGLLGPQVFDIGEIIETDLSVTKSNGADALIPGQQTTYIIVARNAGPNTAVGATITDNFPASLINVSYTSVTTGSVQGATASGTGNIRDVVTMAPNSTITYTVVGTVAANVTAPVVNRVEISVPPGHFDPDITNNTDTDTDPIGRSVDLTITKDDGRREVLVGDVLTYRITARNFGPAAVEGARITDFFPDTLEEISYVSSASTGVTGNTPSGTGDINDVVNMPVGGVISYVVTAKVSSLAAGTLVNRATITPPPGLIDLTPENNIEIDTNLVERELADLSITKDDGLTNVSPGQNITYTIVVTNKGPSNAARVNVLDNFPSTLTNVRYTSRTIGAATGATASGEGDIDDLVDLPVGTSIVYTVSATVASDAAQAVINTATVTTLETDPNPADNSATDIDQLTPQADLSITKTDGLAQVRPGDTLTYTIVVRNSGPSRVTGARVIDNFPATLENVTYTRLIGSQTTNGTGNINDTVDLDANGIITYTVTGTVSATATDAVVNTAVVQPPTGIVDPTPSNNQATDIDQITRSTVDVAVVKDADRLQGTPGDLLRYTIVVSNVGQSAVVGARLVDNFPADFLNVTYTSQTVGQASGNTAIGAGTLNETLNLAPGASVIYVVEGTIRSSATGVLQNLVQVNLDEQVDTNPSNNFDLHVLPLVASADLSITKTDGRTEVDVNDLVTYTIVVRNDGPSDVTGIRVTDVVPPGLTNVQYTSTVQGNASGNTASGSGAIQDTVRMAAGSTITYLMTGRVTDLVSGVLTNTAQVRGPATSAFVERDPTNNTSTDTDVIRGLVVLGSEPTVIRNDLTIEAGQTDRYQITAHSTGKLIITAHFEHARGDLQLAVDDRRGNTIAVVNSADDDELIVIPVVSQEPYFVRVFGANGEVTNSYDLEIENFPAPVPDVIRITPETDSGCTNADALTSEDTPVLVIQADLTDFLQMGIPWLQPTDPVTNNQQVPLGAGVAVEVTLTNSTTGATQVGYATAIGAPNQLFRFVPTPLESGEYVVTAAVRVFDGARTDGVATPVTGRSPRSNPFWLHIDLVEPTAADRPDLLDGSDSGSSFRDDVTNKSRPTLRGTGEPYSKVRIFTNRIGGQAEIVGEGVVRGDGTWEIAVAPLDDDVYHFRAEFEDCAGNISSIGEPLIVEIDSTPPNLPFLDLLRSSDSGLADADEITNDNTPSFSMTSEDPRQSQHLIRFNHKFRLYLRPDAVDGTSPAPEVLIYDSSADNQLPVANLLNGLTDLNQLIRTFGPFPDGVHNLKLEMEDRAGNISPDFLLKFTIDTVPPPAALTLIPSSDSGARGDDRVTHLTEPTFQGTSEIGSTVYLYANGTLVGTTTVGSDESDGVLGNGLGAWKVTSKPLADGEYRFTTRIQDLAGNQNTSTEQTVWVDTREPNIPLLDLLTDTGISDRDDVTRDNTPTLTITAGDTILGGANTFPNDIRYRVYDRPGDGTGEVLLIDSFGALRDLTNAGFFTETLPTLTDGVHNLKVEIEDRAGNVSHAFLLNVVVDTQAPFLTGPELLTSSDSGMNQTDRVTNIQQPAFSGLGTPGDRVRIFAGGRLVGTGLVESDESDGVPGDGRGRWEITVEPLADGTYPVIVESEDLAGNVTRSTATEVTVDTIRPNIPFLDLLTDTGIRDDDNITSTVSPVVSVTANDTPDGGPNPFPHDIKYRLYDRTGAAAEKLLVDSFAQLNDFSTEGFFTHILTDLGAGKHNLKLEVEDRAGNISLPFLLEITIDLGPGNGVVGTIDLADYSDSGSSQTDNVTNIQAPAVHGIGSVNDRVLIYANGILVGEGRVQSDDSDGVPDDGRGVWEVTLEPLRDGVHDLVARFEDEAGNATTTATLKVEIDTLEPNTPALDLFETQDLGRHNDDNITNASQISFSATTTDLNTPNHLVLTPGGQNLKYRIYVRPEEGTEILVYNSATDAALSNKLDGLTAAERITSGLLDLPEGLHNFKLEVEDRAGNVSHDFLMNVLLDRTAYQGTAFLDPSSDTGVLGVPSTFTDLVTRNRTPSFTGTAEANALVTVTIDGVPAGTTVALPFDGDDAIQPPNEPYNIQGNWSLTSKVVLADGTHDVLVTYEDPAGNRATSTLLQLVVDTQGPRIINVTRNVEGFPSVFDPKPSSGPDPLMSSLVIHLTDGPTRTGNTNLDALVERIATEEGNYRLVGDANGNIPIRDVDLILGDATAPGTARIVLHFTQPLPDDRFTLTVDDQLTDAAGNALDGESGAEAPFEGQPGATGVSPIFPTGNGVSGGDFVARFTVDSRPEVGTWGAGSIWVDTNGNFTFDPENLDYVNRDIVYRMGFTSDDVFAGNFALPGRTTDGFDKLAVYGRAEGEFRWLVDTDNDGVPNIDRVEPLAANGLPVAGRFDNNAANGDEVGVFDGRYWYFDTNHDFNTDYTLRSFLVGYPVVGDFDGDGFDDLATWADNRFMIDLARGSLRGWDGQADQTITFGFIGVRERPVAADMDADGVDDLGLWVPDRTGVTDRAQSEWYFLISNGDSLLERVSPPDDPTDSHPVIDFTPKPFGQDIYARFGDDFALPIVGNFDPPTVPNTGNEETPVDTSSVLTNPLNPLDVNADTTVSPLDALLVINELNAAGGGPLAARPATGAYVDVNGDKAVSPIDALLVLNELNRARYQEQQARAARASLAAVPATTLSDAAESWSDETVAELAQALLADAFTANLERGTAAAANEPWLPPVAASQTTATLSANASSVAGLCDAEWHSLFDASEPSGDDPEVDSEDLS